VVMTKTRLSRAWEHETFDELVPFSLPDVAPFSELEEGLCPTQ
jgi:hypothetical protein